MGRKDTLGIAVLAALWGASYLFVHVALRDFPPGTLVWGRVTFGLVVVAVLARATGALEGLRAHWRALAITGLVQIAIPVAREFGPAARRYPAPGREVVVAGALGRHFSGSAGASVLEVVDTILARA